MISTTSSSTVDPAQVADRYAAVWSEPDDDRRRAAVAALWADDAVEYVEGTQFREHDELVARVAHAYAEFVGSGRFTVARAAEVSLHDQVLVLTIQLLGADDGSLAWAARVFLVLDENGRIREDYQLTVQPLNA